MPNILTPVKQMECAGNKEKTYDAVLRLKKKNMHVCMHALYDNYFFFSVKIFDVEFSSYLHVLRSPASKSSFWKLRVCVRDCKIFSTL